MLRIKKIRIENFRGIKPPLELDFKKGKNFTSVAIYGRNGSGKSSIVDAWEWLHNSKIEHLAREDAGEKDYPHKTSDGNNCYIEVEFEHPQLESLKFEFNKKRRTQPFISGDYELFKSLASYPCHLRYRDLQLFIYLTKAKKYEYLAKYLGFETALNIQNGLKTYSNILQEKVKSLMDRIDENISKMEEIIGDQKINKENVIAHINLVCQKHQIDPISEFNSLKEVLAKLKNLVEKNPLTKKLVEWREFKKEFDSLYPIKSVKQDIEKLEKLFRELKADEANITQLLLIDLYKIGLDTLEKLEDKNICPLCDRAFDGDLLTHIETKHQALEALNNKKREFEKVKKEIVAEFNKIRNKLENFEKLELGDIEIVLKKFLEYLKELKDKISEPREILNKELTFIDRIELSNQRFVQIIEKLISLEESTTEKIEQKIEKLENDERRKTLADDYVNLDSLQKIFMEITTKSKQLDFLTKTQSDYDIVFKEYSSWVKSEIQAIFDSISNDVVEYFNLLEDHHQYICKPNIRLLEEKDKAIELEIEFAGEKLSPAYRVLSESQVNSFGLSVFLAAIKKFNDKFKFIILDDVVNSFDAFKRPRIIELINKHFSNYQFLILTHDQIWFDKIQRTFKGWNRLRFYGWDYLTGPKIEMSKSIFEEIEDDLEKDKPIDAGQKLGRYLEWVLQELNENFQTPIKFKIDNQFTLIELFEPFKARVTKKLKAKEKIHLLIAGIETFEQDTIFRNFCMHWKNPAAEYTSDEITNIYHKWKAIENLIYCEECNSYFVYDNKNQYVKCRCGKLDLKAENYYQ